MARRNGKTKYMRFRRKIDDPVWRKAKHGFRGYPILTVAFYGPDDTRATKVAIGLIREEKGETEILDRIHTADRDARDDPSIRERILGHLREQAAATVAMRRTILGCPHEEGIDYAEGASCPYCPAWNRENPEAAVRARELAAAAMKGLLAGGEPEPDGGDEAGTA